MLLELRAENYTVVDRAVVLFGPGLNLLTGETGAGKSILIDALGLLLGGKASADVIRHGAERAVVACVFEGTEGTAAILEANGIDGDLEQVLLRREITHTTKGRVFVNNQPATVGVLRQLAPELALIHSQGETMGGFDQTEQRGVLDRFGVLPTDRVEAAFAAWRGTTRRLQEMETSEQDRLRMADLWRFQSREIEAAGLVDAEEDVRLEAEKRVLANAERLLTAAMIAHDLLYESESAAESTLGAALKQVEELARFDARFAEPAQQLAAAKATVEDVDAEVRRFSETVQAAPERLEEIEDRLAALDRLKRKYGASLAEVMSFGVEAAERLAEVENRDALVAELRAQKAVDAAAYRAAAARLTDARAAAAERLEKRAEVEINALAMQVRFGVRVVRREEETHWTAHGWDEVEYMIATNAGEPMKPLTEIASGGEMSRVMLALKVTVEEGARAEANGKRRRSAGAGVAEAAGLRTLVFDEIDIGIGGRAAEAVGRKLKELAGAQQVLCVTHLPQIAAFADQHFLIAKTERAGRTETAVHRMERDERTEEIARMLSGAMLTETSLRHAEHLIESSR